MKNYTITVNGNVYDVVVEEGASTGAPVAKAPAAPKAAPKAAPAAAPAAPAQEAPKPKFCPNCGAPYEGGKFCQSCGSKLA